MAETGRAQAEALGTAIHYPDHFRAGDVLRRRMPAGVKMIGFAKADDILELERGVLPVADLNCTHLAPLIEALTSGENTPSILVPEQA